MKTRTFFLGLVIGHLIGLTAWSQQFPVQTPGNPNQDPSDQELGAIQGRIFAADGGSPLAKAVVSLGSAGSRRRERPRTVRTNARGEYEFKDLEAGKYVLSATRNGYVPQNYGQKTIQPFRRPQGGTPLSLESGQVLAGIDLKLIRGGVVGGTVVDQDNEPLPRVLVMLSSYRSLGGERRLIPVGRAQTDDRGQFRLFDIPPGSYFLSAAPLGFSSFGRSGRGERSFPPTYYPGVLSPEEASKVEVTAGGEVGGFYFTLIEAHSYSVSGRVLTADGSPADSIWIMTVNESVEAIVAMRGAGTSTDPQGEFKVFNLLPGKHRVIARAGRGGDPQMASAAVEVTDRNIEGLTLVLGEGAEISGRIATESEDSDLDWRRISVSMRGVSGGSRLRFGGRGAEVEEDFTFKLSNLMAGGYRFAVRLPPGNHYVESIRLQGEEVIDRPIEMGDNDRLAGVEVLVSSRGSQISGVVQGEEVRDSVEGATVLIFAADPQNRGNFSRFTKTTQTDQEGRFSLEGLAPAAYLLCALVDHESGRESEPDYLRSLERDSTPIDLSPGQLSQEHLVALPAPKMN